jgi:hypothetical protein
MDVPPNTPRFLCSQLVRLVVCDPRATDTDCLRAQQQPCAAEQWVNLEEIWGSGAVLECEEEVGNGALVKISADDVSFSGRVTAVERHEFGWQVEMAFSPLTPWTIEQWRPEHALDPATLK